MTDRTQPGGDEGADLAPEATPEDRVSLADGVSPVSGQQPLAPPQAVDDQATMTALPRGGFGAPGAEPREWYGSPWPGMSMAPRMTAPQPAMINSCASG